jgi:integral membrane protein (TIGR01906 family)
MERIKQRFLVYGVMLSGSMIYLVILLLGGWQGMLYMHAYFMDHSVEQMNIIVYLHNWHSTGLILFNSDALTIAERRHLLDVKYLFQSLDNLFLYSVLMGIILSVWIRKQISIAGLLLQSVIWGIGGMVLLLLGVTIGFEALFNMVHHYLFLNNTWLFPQNSYLIHLFPLNYFYQFALLYSSIMTAVFLGIVWLAYLKQRQGNPLY